MEAPGINSACTFRLVTSAPRPRELTGAVDLLGYYGLKDYYESLCKKPLPASIAESKYLCDVVGDVEIRRGEDMELGQLLQSFHHPERPQSTHAQILQPFDLELLRKAFTLKESGQCSLSKVDQGMPTFAGKGELKEKDRKHKKRKKHKDRHKDKDRDKDKDKQKDKDKDKDKDREKSSKSKDKNRDKEKDGSKKGENGDDSKRKHHKKKRKHEGEEEEGVGGGGEAHKQKKHKHSSKAVVLPVLTKNGN